MKKLLKNVLVLPTLCIALISCENSKYNLSDTEVESRQPNIIYILTDDMGYGDIEPYGQTEIKTPNLNKMAAAGITFSQHYAGSPVCAPSRAVLMTGQHTGHTLIRSNAGAPNGQAGQLPLEKDTITIAKLLQNAGYATGMFGKWGLGNAETTGNPLKQGFDSYFGYLDQVLAHNYFPEYLLKNDQKIRLNNQVKYLDKNAWHKGLASYSTQKNDYSHTHIMDEAFSFIEQQKDNPFFLYLPVTIPHENDEAPAGEKFEIDSVGDYKDKNWDEDSKRYAASITRLDKDIGTLFEKLASLNIADNTLVIFASDNGSLPDSIPAMKRFDSNGKLRGFKRDLYEGGIRIPMMAVWPGKIKPNSSSDHISAFEDFLPTALEVAKLPAITDIDGLSFLPTLLGKEQKEHEFLYWEFPLTWSGNGNGFQVAVRYGKWKGIKVDLRNNPNAKIQLFDVGSDIEETNDLALQFPEIVEKINSFMQESHTESLHFPMPKFSTKID